MAAPIGVDFDRISRTARDPRLLVEKDRLRRELRMAAPIVGVGVDRLDYTKGIPERLDAIDRLLTETPDLASQMLFVQIGVPSRSKLDELCRRSSRRSTPRSPTINTRHGRGPADGPIRYRKSALKLRRLVALYQLADFCVVSSLHDGMNLVAKEFVAARHDEGGVLVLSEMTGAAQELKDAVIINPYDGAGLHRARCGRRSRCRRSERARADAAPAPGRRRPRRVPLGVRDPRQPAEAATGRRAWFDRVA